MGGPPDIDINLVDSYDYSPRARVLCIRNNDKRLTYELMQYSRHHKHGNSYTTGDNLTQSGGLERHND